MPLLLAALWGTLASVVGSLVARVLVSLGLGFVTFSGVSALLTWVKNAFLSGVGGLPADAVGILYTAKVDMCVSMLLSALTIRLTMQGLSAGGSITRMVQKS